MSLHMRYRAKPGMTIFELVAGIGTLRAKRVGVPMPAMTDTQREGYG